MFCFVTVESYDRSTTREYGDLSKDMSDKYKTLKASEEEAVKLSSQHYKSILRQVRAVPWQDSQKQEGVYLPTHACYLSIIIVGSQCGFEVIC